MKSLHSIRIVAIALAVITVSGCSTNNWSIRLAYSRLDNNIAGNFDEYARFDNAQRQWIRESAREFQLWHRKNELPIYAELLLDLALLIESREVVSIGTVQDVFDELEELSNRSYRKSPFANSLTFLEVLSDEQVDQIAETFDRQNEDQLKRIREQESTPDNQGRIDRLDNNLSRFGLNLSPPQRQIIDQGMRSYVGSREDRVLVWASWQDRFLETLGARGQITFAQAMQKEIDEYRFQMEIAYPRRSARNTETAARTVAALVNSLSDEQRIELVTHMREASGVFNAMATSKQTEII